MMNFRQFLETTDDDEDYEFNWQDEEEPKVYRPGQMTDDYEHFEPEKEPVDWDEWLTNMFSDFGLSDSINASSGYLLTNGQAVQLGRYNRDQDHRYAVPTSIAMKRWGWPEEIIKKYEQGSTTPAMKEFMRRSGAMRIGAGSGSFFVHGMTWPTARQRDAIIEYIMKNNPRSVTIEMPTGRPGGVELSSPDVYEVEELLRPR